MVNRSWSTKKSTFNFHYQILHLTNNCSKFRCFILNCSKLTLLWGFQEKSRVVKILIFPFSHLFWLWKRASILFQREKCYVESMVRLLSTCLVLLAKSEKFDCDGDYGGLAGNWDFVYNNTLFTLNLCQVTFFWEITVVGSNKRIFSLFRSKIRNFTNKGTAKIPLFRRYMAQEML